MKKFMNFFKKSQSGATLVIVVGVFSLLLIFVTASLSVATAARQQTYNEYCAKQAYYTANSAVNLFAGKVSTDTNLNTLVKSLSAGGSYKTGKSNVPGLGEVEYLIKKDTNGKVTVTARAYYQSTISQSSVVLNGKETDPKMPLFSAAAVSFSETGFSNSFFATGDIINSLPTMQMTNNGIIYGNLYTDGNIEFNSNGSIVQGTNNDEFSMIATGNVYMCNGSVIKYSEYVHKAFINCQNFRVDNDPSIGNPNKYIDIHCNSLNMSNSPTLYANVNLYKVAGVQPTIAVPNSPTIAGDVYIDGNIVFKSNIHIKGDLIITGDANLQNLTVDGNIYCKTYTGTGVNCRGQIHAVTGGQTWNETADRPKLASKPKPEIPKPADVFKPFEGEAESYINYTEINNGLSYDGNQDNLVINRSGTINGGMWDKRVTINVADKTIWIKLNCDQIGKTEITINKSAAFPETPVYFVVPNGKTINISNGAKVLTNITKSKIANHEIFYVGNRDDDSHAITKGQQVYWLTERNSNVRVTTNSTIEGYVYGPHATFEAANIGAENITYSLYGHTSGDGVNTITPPLIGALVVDTVKVSNTCGILYLVPASEGLPDTSTTDPSNFQAIYTIDGYTRK